MKIKYSEYLERSSFSKEELLASSWGSLVSDPPYGKDGTLDIPTLPSPPMLMFDRIVEVKKNGNKGHIAAEQDISLSDWFFQCHFRGDPVQPGCLGVDAVWQLLGFYASLCGALGSGRALGAKEIEFFGQIRPHNKIVRYDIDVRRYMENASTQSTLIVGSAIVSVDGESVYSVKEAKVGSFRGIKYINYPHKADNAFGGRMGKE